MLKSTKGVVVALLVSAGLALSQAAEADPLLPFQVQFPFTDPDSAHVYTQFRVGFEYDTFGVLTGLTLLSADHDLSAFTSNPIFTSSSPAGELPLTPPGDAYVGAFKLPAMTTNTFTADPDSGSIFSSFGAGVFAVLALGATPCSAGPDCWLSASFSSATFQLENGAPTNFFGEASFDGPIFGDTGLVNPGTFAFSLVGPGTLIGATDDMAFYDYTATGVFQATPKQVPEPSTLAMMGLAVVAGVAKRWKSRRRTSASSRS